MAFYTVKQGDCVNSIADERGFHWEAIWLHPDNANLRGNRDNPGVLQEGDQLFVPEIEQKNESGATEEKHKFKRLGVPAKIRVQLMKQDEPRAGEAYRLEVDDQTFEGETDGSGILEEVVPPTAQSGTLYLRDGKEVVQLSLGYLNPVEEMTGVQQRLANMGLYAGKIDGEHGRETREAIGEFQRKHDIEVTGDIDDETLNALRDEHDKAS